MIARLCRCMGGFRCALAVVAVCSSLGAGQEPTVHSVAGVVIGADGSKIQGACVIASPSGNSAGSLSCIQTDQEGRFTVKLRPGTYLIRARDDRQGYPDPMYLLSSDPTAKFPEIVVGESDISGVTVTLGAKGGVLEGYVRDAESLAPIASAKVTISDARNPAAYVEVFSNKDGHFQFTVPAKPLFVSTMAAGYKRAKTTEIALAGGENRDLEIELDRK